MKPLIVASIKFSTKCKLLSFNSRCRSGSVNSYSCGVYSYSRINSS
jgi:hypothetical protein